MSRPEGGEWRRMGEFDNRLIPIRGPQPRGVVDFTGRPLVKQGIPVNSLRGTVRPDMKRPAPTNGAIPSPSKERMDMDDSEDYQAMSMQHQRDGPGGVVGSTVRPLVKQGIPVNSLRGTVRPDMKRPAPTNGAITSPSKKRMDMNDSEDCQIVSIQHPRKKKNPVGVQPSRQLTMTKTKVRPPKKASKNGNSLANVLASRGTKITAKSKTPPPSVSVSEISVTPTRTISEEEHRQHFHSNCSSEMELPVVDLSQPATQRKLNKIGIKNCIPLANKDQGSGRFVIPIVSIQSAMSVSSNTLSALGANGTLTLGPIKPLSKN